MALFFKGKWPRLILASYLVFAIMGVFTFAAAEPLRSVDLWDDEPFSGGFFTPIDYAIDCLAEGETLMSRARGHSFSPLRTGSLRIPAPPGLQNTGVFLVKSSLRNSEKADYPDIKKAIPLKLLI